MPLANFRGSVRPVLLAGSQGYLNRALKASELFRTELRARGISVIPIALTSKDPGEKLAALKRDFRYTGMNSHTSAMSTGCPRPTPQKLLRMILYGPNSQGAPERASQCLRTGLWLQGREGEQERGLWQQSEPHAEQRCESTAAQGGQEVAAAGCKL